MSRNLSQDRKQEKEVDQPPSFLSAGTRKSFPGISSRSSHRPGLTQNLQGYFGHCLSLGTTQNKAGFSLQGRREKGEGNWAGSQSWAVSVFAGKADTGEGKHSVANIALQTVRK